MQFIHTNLHRHSVYVLLCIVILILLYVYVYACTFLVIYDTLSTAYATLYVLFYSLYTYTRVVLLPICCNTITCYSYPLYTYYTQPENILIDDNGYIRLIDFGFAKRVPYTKLDINGVEKTYTRTYTLCGTPG